VTERLIVVIYIRVVTADRQTDGRTDGQWQCVDDSTLLAAITTQPGGRRRDSRQNGGVRKDPLTPQFPKPLITVGDRKVVTAD